MVGLRDGTVLAVGTYEGDSDPTPDAHRYDPVAGTWTDAHGLAQFGYALVAMPDGGALAVGGGDGGELWGGTGALTSRVHRFDPATGTWIEVASMATPRWEPQVVVLADGRRIAARARRTPRRPRGLRACGLGLGAPAASARSATARSR